MTSLTKLKNLNPGTSEIKQTVKIGTKSLLMTIRENSDSVNIYIGGHDLYCIYMYIMKDKSIYSSRFDTSIANLPGSCRSDPTRHAFVEFAFHDIGFIRKLPIPRRAIHGISDWPLLGPAAVIRRLRPQEEGADSACGSNPVRPCHFPKARLGELR